jgi:outer membrane protein TolC
MWFRPTRPAGCVVLLAAAATSFAQPPAHELAPPRPAAPAGMYPSTRTAYPIDLPTALRLADADNPTVNLARARARQAVAQLDRARVAWVPNLTFGPTLFYHEGIDQNRRGDLFSVSRGYFAVVGGPTARVDLGDAFYLPLVARRAAEAAGSRSRAAANDVQLEVALAYLDLIEVHGQRAINARTLYRVEQMLAAAEVGGRAGANKTPADVNRAATEVNLRREEAEVLRGRAGAAAARLARLLRLDPAVELVPYEVAVVPLVLVPGEVPLERLVEVGLRGRPEVAAAAAEVQAAGALARQARQAPLIPRVEAQFLGGGFSGWRQTRPDVSSPMLGQYNAGVGLVWQLDALGAGNAAQARARDAGYAAAVYALEEVRARVGAEVADAARTAAARFAALGPAQEAVRQAQEMGRKFREVKFGLAGPKKGQFDALEPLTGVQALNNARVEYLRQVVDFNRAQFRLHTALGRPAFGGLGAAVPRPVDIPAIPADRPPPEPPPAGPDRR